MEPSSFNIQGIVEKEHERPLFMRVMFGGDNSTSPPKVSNTPINDTAMSTSSDVPMIPLMIGGKTKKGGNTSDSTDIILSESLYFRKINTLFIILFISIVITIGVVNMFVGMIFNDDDTNFENQESDYQIRWKRVMKLTVLFITLIILCHFIIILLILLYFVIKIGVTNEDPNAQIFSIAWAKVKEMVWEYKDDMNNDVGLIGYYMLLFTVLVLLFIFFIIYTLLAKGYINELMYESIYDESNPDAEDRTQPDKFIFQYGVYIVVMMLFVLLLLNYDKLRDKKIIFIYNVVFVLAYVVLTLNILRCQLNKRFSKFILYTVLFLTLFFLYPQILKTMAKFLPS